MSLDSFMEDMHTECSMIGNPIIPMQAIKVDGEGNGSLKYQLCENSFKSCDYIKFTDRSICFIEFSDLYEQLNFLRTISSAITTSDIGHSDLQTLTRNKVIAKEPTVIKNEIQIKISESLLVFKLISDQYSIIEHINKNKIFIIALCKIIVADIIMFDNIQRDLERKFQTILKIKMLPYDHLTNYITTQA